MDGFHFFHLRKSSPGPRKGTFVTLPKGTVFKGHGKKWIGYSGIPKEKSLITRKTGTYFFHLTQ